MTEPALSFAGLLRRLRTEARLTQEELAEASSLSPRSVSDLERGVNRTARKDTALLLADALRLSGQERVLFVAAARGRGPAAEVLLARSGTGPGAAAEPGAGGYGAPGDGPAAATRTLPRDIGGFTGREPELDLVLDTLAAVTGNPASPGGGSGGSPGTAGICAIDGMAGCGKTTLAVHAAHRIAESFPDGQFFLPLHAHTPGQRPADPADALGSLLLAAGLAARQVPPGLEARAGRWRDYLAGKRVLLVLDDAAGHEQVRPLLPGTAGSLVLITSRRRLTALEDAAVISIGTLPPADAAALLARLAGREELAGPAGPAGELARLCGYLPLAIGMLARQLRHHPARSPADLAAALSAARDRLAILRAENLSVAAAFELSHRDLGADQQRLFARLGLVPGPDSDAYAAAVVGDISLRDAGLRLDELYDQHLITEPSSGRYVLHDLLREYARGLAADDPGGPAAARRLMDYYAHAAAAAGQHIATWTTAGRRPPPGDRPASMPLLADAGQAADWLAAERPNLHAAIGQAAAQGMPQHAIAIATAIGGYLRARGHWDQAAAQYRTALAAARRAGDGAGQAGALDEIGLLHQLTADYPAATASLTRALQLFTRLGDRSGQAHVLNHLGLVQVDTGDYAAAAASHQRALDLALAAADQLAEAVSRTDLGLVQQLTGDFPAAIAGYRQALTLLRRLDPRFDLADTLVELGMAYRQTGDYRAAAACHRQSLAEFRGIGDRLGQAWALDELGLVQQLTGDYPAAAASLGQALALHRELGSPQGQAVVLNSLGELASATQAPEQARARHREALAIASDVGAPLQQARALEGIGSSLLPGEPAEAATHLRQAQAIYQRLGSPDASRVRDLLAGNGL